MGIDSRWGLLITHCLGDEESIAEKGDLGNN